MICNYCHMKAIENTAKRAGLTVVKKGDPGVHHMPTGIRIMVRGPEEELDWDKHFVAWFAALPSRCHC